MTSQFRLIIATLLLGFSALALAASTEAGLLGNTVGGAVGAAKGAIGGVGGAFGGSSSGSNSSDTTAGAAVGNTTAKASVVLRKKNFAKNALSVTFDKTTNLNAKVLSSEIDLTLGPTGTRPAQPSRRNRSAAAQMFKDMSPAEQRKLVKKCSHVLATPAAFDRDLVILCRMIAAIDSQPERRATQPTKKKTSSAKPMPKHLANMEPLLPGPILSPVNRKSDAVKENREVVAHCLGSEELSPAEVMQLEKDIPGCIIRE